MDNNIAEIGIIGGSGLDDADILKNAKDLEIETRYGRPSSPIKIGEIKGKKVAFLARHGRHHTIPPTQINFRANILALKELGVKSILASTACGSLKKEIELIESSITLMQLRFSEKVKISIDVPKNIPDIQIPPMLFISFLENAFKHGVSYQANSFVDFKLEVAEDHLNCVIKNSKQRVKENFDKSYSGIGLTNIRKSLELLFAKDYTLNISENDKAFEVFLTIPIYDNKMYSH